MFFDFIKNTNINTIVPIVLHTTLHQHYLAKTIRIDLSLHRACVYFPLNFQKNQCALCISLHVIDTT